MAFSEIDSFLGKFKHLWHAGLKASLKIEAENGEAFVSLTVGLGHIPPPFFPPRHTPPVQRGPSYQRRQERRRKAANATPPTQDSCAEEAQQEVDNVDNNKDENVEVIAIAEEVTASASKAEEAKKDFQCELCDFKSIWKNGLEIHMNKMHKEIEQLDGHSELIADEEYNRSKHYWKTGYLGTAFQSYLDAKQLIDESDLSEEDKEQEKQNLLEARKNAFGTNYRYYPPWSNG